MYVCSFGVRLLLDICWAMMIAVDREIFMLKRICVKNFCGVKFSWFGLICENFLTVEDRRVP